MRAGGRPEWRVAILGLVGLTVFTSGLALSYAALHLAYPWDRIDDSLHVADAYRMLHGLGLYRTWGGSSWIYPVFPPAYYGLLGLPTAVAGTSLWPGRLVSAGGLLVAVLASRRTASELGASRPLAWFAAASVLAFPEVMFLVPLVRPDALALGITAGLILAATMWESERSTRLMVAVGALSILLVATKENYSPLVLAVAAAILLRDRRTGLVLIAFTASGILLIFGLADAVSNGDFFKDIAADGRLSLRAFTETTAPVLLRWPHPAVVLAPLYVLYSWGSRRSIRAAELALVGSVFVGLSAVKVGSAAHYWAPFDLVASTLLGPALAWFMRGVRWSGGLVPVAVASVLMVSPVIASAQIVANAYADLGRADRVNRDAADRMRPFAAALLGDRADLSLAAGALPRFDPWVMSEAQVSGRWNAGDLVRSVRRHAFSAIQTSFDVRGEVPEYQGQPAWPPEVASAVRSTYCVSWTAEYPPIYGHAGGVWIYLPC